MGLLAILTTITNKHIGTKTVHPEMARTPTPLGMHQGSVVEMPDIDIALSQSDGSIIKAPVGTQIVTAVGKYHLFNLDIYHVYLNDGISYIQIITKNDVPQEARLFTSHAEILPQSVEDWEFWLGSYQKTPNGEFARDASGNSIRKEFGLIGWAQFQIDGPPTVIYNRTWNASSEGIDPIAYVETITDSRGHVTTAKHEACEYFRHLTSAKDSVIEYLTTTMVNQNNEASVNIFIGIPLDLQNLKILSV